MFKQEKGITLVSLVITIIIMLILAGVSLSMVMGDGSLLDQANAAVDNTELGTVKDEVGVAVAGAQTNYYATYAETTRSTLVHELTTLPKSEFASATEVVVVTPTLTDLAGTSYKTANVDAADDSAVYYKASSNVIYKATLDITANTIKVVSVEKTDLTAMPTATGTQTATTLS